MTYEGQAAMWLEGLAREASSATAFARLGARDAADGYPLPFDGESWDHAVLLAAVLGDLEGGTPARVVALRFHAGVADGVVNAAKHLRERHPSDVVALSGGVWQNRLLFEHAVVGLEAAGFAVWWNERVPLGDGGVSLGQVAMAAAKGRFALPR